MFLRALALGIIVILTQTPGFAAPPACNAGSEGTILYNKDHKVVQFCNSTDWIAMSGAFGGGGGSSVWLDDGPGGPGEIYYNGGNVGIGTTDPSSALSVVGNISASSSAASSIVSTNTSLSGGVAQLYLGNTGAGGTNWAISAGNTATGVLGANLGISEGSDYRFVIKQGGNVGIGTTAPATKLHLNRTENGSNVIQIETPGVDTAQQSILSLATVGDGNALGLAGNKGWTIYGRGNAYLTAAQQNDFGIGYWNGSAWLTGLAIDSVNASVGIGATAPDTKLHVAGTLKIADGAEACNAAAHEGAIRYVAASDAFQMCRSAGTGWEALGAGGGDDLGDHTATQNLDLGAFKVTNANAVGMNLIAGNAPVGAPGGPGTLPALASANLWVGNGTNEATAVSLSGDASMTNAGVLTIGSNAVGSAEIADSSITSADIAADTIAAVDIATGGVATAEILDGTIALGDLSATGAASASTYLRGDNTWASVAGDNLGNHTATANLAMGGFTLSNANFVSINHASDAYIALKETTTNDGFYIGTDTDWPGSFVFRVVDNSVTAGSPIASISQTGTITGTLFAGSGASLTSLNATNLASGTVPTARLGSGTANTTTFLRGDNTWATVAGDDLGAGGTTTGTLYSKNASGYGYVGAESGASSSFVRFDAAPAASAGRMYVNLLNVWEYVLHSDYLGPYQTNLNDLGTSAVRWKDGWFAGDVTAATFAGSGASLTSLNATNLGSGTLPAARMPALTGDVTMTAGTTTTAIAPSVVTTTEILDSTIASADIAVDTIVAADIAANAITASELATDAVTNVKVAADAIGIAELSATGTPSSTTFLRGDNTWATPAGGGGGTNCAAGSSLTFLCISKSCSTSVVSSNWFTCPAINHGTVGTCSGDVNVRVLCLNGVRDQVGLPYYSEACN